MERRLNGVGVAPGIAIGSVYLPHAEEGPVVPESAPPERLELEVDAFRAARARAADELATLRARVQTEIGERFAGILDAQLLILDDPAFEAEVVHRIRIGRVSARWSIQSVLGEHARRLSAVEDLYLRERGGDLDDLRRRLQRLLRVRDEDAVRRPEDGPWVAVAHGLGPSDAVDLARRGVVGLATDVGGRTSHTAILAQALGVPAVAGLRDVSRAARPGDAVIVDGDRGEVVLSPSPPTLVASTARRAAWVEREARAAASDGAAPAHTADGATVVLRASIEFPEEAAAARRFGALGIGLYRSEFLFLAHAPTFPTEDEHHATYRALARSLAPHPVVVRTLDLGGEKYFHDVLDRRETNPVLGLRAVRLCLLRPDVFRPQIRGLLRAAVEPNLRVMLPFVTAPEEIREVRRLWHEQASELRAAGQPVREDAPIGVMVEVPSAAIAADVLAREADFLSVGTNDLIQYALAVDRGNESVSYLYRPDHPGVLRLVRCVVEAAARRGLALSVCGEMAADPAYLPLLIGLGVRELSVQPRSLLDVREAVARIDSVEAERAVEAALA